MDSFFFRVIVFRIFVLVLLSFFSLFAFSQSQTLIYTYDALGRVTFVEDTANGNRDYDYDPAGNRTEVVIGAATDDPPPPANMPAPTGLSYSQIANCAYQARWSAVTGATHYFVRDTLGQEQRTAQTVANVPCTYNQPNSNKPYSVRACNETICSTTARF
jgi:YD repeat-containing protein